MNDEIKINPQLLDSKQQDIYKHLKEIGEEIAAFYLDGVRILNNENLQTKSNLLAHVAREIDGGLRDILASKDIIDPTKTIARDEIKELKSEINKELESKGIDKIDTINRHIISVCNSLNLDSTSDLLKKWVMCSSQFHKFAHRHGAYRNPRPLTIFQDIWARYEDVLFRLIGSYYRLLDRIDTLLKKDQPSDDIIKALPNLFKIEARQHYFFSNLDKVGWLKSLKEADFFNPVNNPKPVENLDGNGYFLPYWSALNYLERITSKTQGNDTDLIIDIIEEIINYREEGQRIVNSRTDYQLFKIICALPSDKIAKEHIDFIAEALVSDFHNTLISAEIGKILIPKLITDNNKARLLELLEVVTRYRLNEKSLPDKVEPIIKEYWFADLVNKNDQTITTFLGLDIVSLFIDRIREVNKADTHSFSTTWIPTIEDHEQHSFPNRYEAVLIRFLRNSLLLLDITDFKPLVQKLLDDELIILKRLAFFAINQKYAELHELLWNVGENPIELFNCKHELYELFKNHAEDLDSDEITKVIEWIEGITLLHPMEEEQEYQAHRRKEWYSALLDSGDERILENYEKCNELSPRPIEHEGFVSWSEALIGEVSPLQEIELSQMTNGAIADYLINFKEHRGIREPTEMGLAEILTTAVKLNPDKFSKELNIYEKSPPIYHHALLNGFSQAWNDNKKINWEEILEYVLYTLKKENKQEDSSEGFDYYEWFISQACRLIKDGTKSDEHAFDEKLLPLAKEILLFVNMKVIAGEYSGDDYVNFIFNSTKGNLLNAMLNYSLRLARVRTENEWDNDIQKIYDDELNTNPSLELHTHLALHIRNFLYLNEEWVKKKVRFIFPEDKPEHLHAALDGYLFNSTVYNETYQMLKNADVYATSIKKWNENTKLIKEKLVTHVCLAYVEGWESIEDEKSLINLLLGEKETHGEIINFFDMRLKSLKKEDNPRVKVLWKLLFDLNKETNKPILGKLTKWLAFFEILDDDLFFWSKKGVSHIQAHWEIDNFIENITEFTETEPKKVGKLVCVLIAEGKQMLDQETNIVRIVETLYQSGDQEMANDICNKLGERGVFFLREVYDRNNISKQRVMISD